MNHRALQIAAAAALAVLVFPHHGPAQTVDDNFLIQTSVHPNVMLFLDNSAAMNQIEWHPAYSALILADPSYTPTCANWSNTTTYTFTSALNNENHCGNVRDIYAPNNPTFWDGRYLNWYFSDAADAYATEIATAIAPVAGCNQAGGKTRFSKQYRRTRADAARQVFFDTLCLSEPKNLRFGLAQFRSPEDPPQNDPNGGFVAVAIDDNTPAHAADLEAQVGNTKLDATAPLAEAIFQTYTYLMPRTGNAKCAAASPAVSCPPRGNDGATQFPSYGYDKFGNVPGATSNILTDPVQEACQKNFLIIVTSGLDSHDDFDVEQTTNEAAGFSNFGALIGDYYAEGDTETPGGTNEESWYLDDIAKYMHEKDLRPEFADDQNVDTYTIGFGTSLAQDTFLRRVADVGDGLSFHADDGAALSRALLSALNDIVEKSRSFTAATVPSARTADGGDFYNSFFLPSSKSAFWEGHLRSWHFTASGEIVDRNNHCALVDPDGGTECNNGPFAPICQTGQTWPACVEPFWDAGEVTLSSLNPGTANSATGARQLFTSKLNAGSPPVPVRTDFDFALTAADLKISAFTTPGDPAPNSALYPLKGSTAITAEGLADEVIAYGRGCLFGTGVTDSSLVSTPEACQERLWVIGDIFHSDPIVVRGPFDRPALGTAYDTFRTHYGTRDRVIYTGTNAGFLEAFHAGDWISTPSPGKYNEGTGVELFGLMPWQPRTKIKNQPVDAPTARTHFVDGAPQVSDAWLYSTWTVATQTAAEWRTMLVGGLREGGRHYFATDITNPSGIAPPGGGTALAYPSIQWEFPNENDFNSGTGDYVHMGQTWGQPVITRVKLDASGTTVERWVAIVSAGYDETSDPNATYVDPSAGQFVTSSTCSTTSPPTCRGRAIYMLDIKTGKVIAMQKMGFNADADGSTTPESGMLYSLVSTPAVLDLDGDGFADVIYIGDLGGNLWKWVVKPVGQDRVNDGSGVRTQPAWKFQKFFKAPVFVQSGDTFYRNIFQPPAAAFVGSTLWITFGTGQRAAIGFNDDTDGDEVPDDHTGEENRYYVISDPDPLALAAGTPNVVTEPPTSGSCAAGYTCTINDITVTTPGARGYFLKGTNGEKFTTTSAIFAGDVITASFTPSQCYPGAATCVFDPCTQRGSGKLYVFDLATGQGELTDASGNPTRYTSLGSGLPTDPKISIGVGGEDNKIVIQKSGTDIEIMDAEDVDFGRGIIYWREMH